MFHMNKSPAAVYCTKYQLLTRIAVNQIRVRVRVRIRERVGLVV